ncbi:hypothetical protein DPMN_161559 [Dreissena polymorpha]|uniref:Uncharacterized protein n=1 Tax=Dreissena polymorpha TaxID=45954 RepID=A0A9D4ETD6_DREPO|nr:hypothetical protein DPMN_161559 [Dreissena polymorpha]
MPEPEAKRQNSEKKSDQISTIHMYSKPERIARKNVKTVMEKNWGLIANEEGLNKGQFAPSNQPEIPPATSYLPIKCCAPTKEEIHGAIKQFTNGKSAGPDIIPS